MSATTAPAITFRDGRGTAPKASDNLVSLAYKLGIDHALAGVREPEMVVVDLRDIYLNGWAVGEAAR